MRAISARNYVRDLLIDESVELTDIENDKYGGRVLAEVWLSSGESLSEKLILDSHGRAIGGAKIGWILPRRFGACLGDARATIASMAMGNRAGFDTARCGYRGSPVVDDPHGGRGFPYRGNAGPGRRVRRFQGPPAMGADGRGFGRRRYGRDVAGGCGRFSARPRIDNTASDRSPMKSSKSRSAANRRRGSVHGLPSSRTTLAAVVSTVCDECRSIVGVGVSGWSI